MDALHASHDLQIDLATCTLGVGKIFLHRRIRNEIAVRYGHHGFSSIPIFAHEKCEFVLRTEPFWSLLDEHKTTLFLFVLENEPTEHRKNAF